VRLRHGAQIEVRQNVGVADEERLAAFEQRRRLLERAARVDFFL